MRLRLNVRALKAGATFLVLLVLLLAGGLVLRRWEEARPGPPVPLEEEPEDQRELVSYGGAWYAPREDLETVLFLGLDKAALDDSIPVSGDYAQADFVALLVLDPGTESGKLIHINRDTMTDIPDFDASGRPLGTYTGQLALAYAHAQAYTGSERTACESAKKAVSQLLYGVEIDHYVTLTLDGVACLNDLAGGVEVEVQDDFSAVDKTLVQGETVTLLGEHALNYVRARWWVGDSSNLERMERQSEYLDALWKKLNERMKADEGFALSALAALSDYMSSDCTAEQKARTYEAGQTSLAGEAVTGERYMEFYADEDALRELVVDTFFEFVKEPKELG